MVDPHKKLKRQFLSLFHHDGRGVAEDRSFVLDTFLEFDSHVTVGELLQRIEEKGKSLGESFVRESLDLFLRYGIATATHFEGQETRYEHLHLDAHHDHFVCVRCGKIIEFRDPRIEALQLDMAVAHGFYSLRHRMEVYGLCPRCRGREEEAVPLSSIPNGGRCRVTRFECGPDEERQLVELGLPVGTAVKVIQNAPPGPQVVAVQGMRIGIDCRLVSKIMVSMIEDTSGYEMGDRDEARSGTAVREPEPPMPGPVDPSGPPHRRRRGWGRLKGYARKSRGEQPGRGRRLNDYREGESGKVKKLLGRGKFRHRLIEMGFTEGTEVHVEKYAPLRDPIELVIKGYHVSLRRDEAAEIIMED